MYKKRAAFLRSFLMLVWILRGFATQDDDPLVVRQVATQLAARLAAARSWRNASIFVLDSPHC